MNLKILSFFMIAAMLLSYIPTTVFATKQNGWNTSPNGSGIAFNAGQINVNMSALGLGGANVTLYAQWEPDPHSSPDVTYLLWPTGSKEVTLWYGQLDHLSAVESRGLNIQGAIGAEVVSPVYGIVSSITGGRIYIDFTHNGVMSQVVLGNVTSAERIAVGTRIRQGELVGFVREHGGRGVLELELLRSGSLVNPALYFDLSGMSEGFLGLPMANFFERNASGFARSGVNQNDLNYALNLGLEDGEVYLRRLIEMIFYSQGLASEGLTIDDVLHWNPETRSITVTLGDEIMIFVPEDQYIQGEGLELYHDGVSRLSTSNPRVSIHRYTNRNHRAVLESELWVQDATKGVEAMLRKLETFNGYRDVRARLEGRSIFLDPGHGGSELGAVRVFRGVTYYEKDINLDVALHVRDILQRYGIVVYMSRTIDINVNNLTRSIVANNLNVDIFESVHHNSARQIFWGSEMLYSSALGSFDLAVAIQGSVLGNTELNRRPLSHLRSRDDIEVLRETNMPAVVTETGYMGNDIEYIINHPNETAKAIAWGIMYYFYSY